MKLLLALSLTVFALLPIPPISIAPQVAPPVVLPADANGCSQVGTVGTVIVALCVSDSGEAVWANSAGFLSPVP